MKRHIQVGNISFSELSHSLESLCLTSLLSMRLLGSQKILLLAIYCRLILAKNYQQIRWMYCFFIFIIVVSNPVACAIGLATS